MSFKRVEFNLVQVIFMRNCTLNLRTKLINEFR